MKKVNKSDVRRVLLDFEQARAYFDAVGAPVARRKALDKAAEAVFELFEPKPSDALPAQ